MSTFRLDDLTEDVFGHLCNVALNKCSDKFEKKKAGCGGRAMRKRVLIKNFVSDLFKMHKKPHVGKVKELVSSDDEFDDYEMAEEDVTFYDEDMEEDINYNNEISNNDCWLSQADVYRNENPPTYYDRPFCNYDNQPSSYAIYDIYSNVSEQANEGDIPSPSDPLASISSIMHPSETSFDMYSSGTAVNYFPTEEYFLTNPSYLDPMVSQAQQVEEETHELTDLDVTTGESNRYKRKSTEIFDDFNMAFQKRIKI